MIEPGTGLILCGLLVILFHRHFARHCAAFSQTSLVMTEKMLEWSGLLGGAVCVIMGMALLGYPGHTLGKLLVLGIGFFSIFFSDWNARRSILWYQSEKRQRIHLLLLASMMLTIGVLKLSHVLDS
jgi:hypothetical protein